METLIEALLNNEMAIDRAEAIDMIESMRQEVEDGEDIQDVLAQYDLDLDDAIHLLEI
jgi:hypothetical protein